MSTARPKRSGLSGRQLLVAVALTALTLAVFWPVGRSEFTNFDDDKCVTDNPVVREGWTLAGVRWAFFSADATRLTGWLPLTWLSHMTDVELFGLAPGAHHLVSLAFHAGNTLLLFLILSAATGTLWPGAVAAALFAVHPLHVESVAWVAERKDVLSTFLWLLTTGAYLRFLRRPGAARYLSVVLLFALGLMAKPMLVTLPLTLLLWDGWPLGRIRSSGSGGRDLLQSRLVLEKIPLLGLSVAVSAMTLLAQARGRTLISLQDLPLASRLSNALVSYAAYVGKMFWPRGLAVHYPHPAGSEPLWLVVLAAAVLGLVTVACLRERRRRPFLTVGWLWYLGTLVPVIGLVQVSLQGMTDRYTYVPLIGPFIMIAWSAAGWAPAIRRRHRLLLPAAGAAVLLLLGALAHRQTAHWRDSVALARRALAVTSRNWLAHAMLGNASFSRGDRGGAEREYVEALKIMPIMPEIRNNLGNVYLLQGRVEEAIREYSAAVAQAPADGIARENLRRAQALRETSTGAGEHLRQGNLLYRQGRLEEAAEEYRAALARDASAADAHSNLGSALYSLGKNAAAIEEFREAIRLSPDVADYHYNLGAALGRTGAAAEATEHYRQALRLKPDLTEARQALDRIRRTPEP